MTSYNILKFWDLLLTVTTHAIVYVLLFLPIYWSYNLEPRQYVLTGPRGKGYDLPLEETGPTRACPWSLWIRQRISTGNCAVLKQ
jgi:hypothetical protein